MVCSVVPVSVSVKRNYYTGILILILEQGEILIHLVMLVMILFLEARETI